MSPRADEPDRRDAADEVLAKLTPHVEPPPMSRPTIPIPYAYPIPFGEPPPEPVTLVDGEIPWELREDDEPGSPDRQ